MDSIVPHRDAAEILHGEWWETTVYTCGKEGKIKTEEGWNIIEDSPPPNLYHELYFVII